MSNESGETSALVPLLRFPEFSDAAEWKRKQLSGLISTVTPPKKIPTTEYLAKGQFPIIDQGQSDIAGWTDDPDSLVEENEPLIIFGDHTCALKLVCGPFAQGADGIKILKGNGLVTTEFLYQHLCFRPVLPEEYKRHFSILRDKAIAYPEEKSGEQQKIADCLSSLDELITAETQKLGALKTHKRGLMQQIFPREGETVPQLRFPEFRDAGEWEEKQIGDLQPFVTSGSRGWAAYYANQGSLFVRITNLTRESIYLDLANTKFVKLPQEASEGVRTQLKEFDLLISITADIGIIGYVDASVPSPAYINQHIALVRFDTSQVCSQYVSYFLASERSQRHFHASTDVGTKAGMNLLAVQQIQLVLPALPEQQKIAAFLASLDDLITDQNLTVNALKTHKKGLMQQLFPTLVEVPA